MSSTLRFGGNLKNVTIGKVEKFGSSNDPNKGEVVRIENAENVEIGEVVEWSNEALAHKFFATPPEELPKDDNKLLECIISVGENNFIPSNEFFFNGLKASRSVCRILKKQDPETSSSYSKSSNTSTSSLSSKPKYIADGSGFFYNGYIFTNNHVIKGIGKRDEFVFEFDYDKIGFPTIQLFGDPNDFYTSVDLDFTVIKLILPNSSSFDPKDRSAILAKMDSSSSRSNNNNNHTSQGAPCNIIGHPQGRPKEVVLQKNGIHSSTNIVVHYTTDTEPGSSGSPVYNNSWEVFAIHHSSGKKAWSWKSLGNKFITNEGVLISAIKKDIFQHNKKLYYNLWQE